MQDHLLPISVNFSDDFYNYSFSPNKTTNISLRLYTNEISIKSKTKQKNKKKEKSPIKNKAIILAGDKKFLLNYFCVPRSLVVAMCDDDMAIALYISKMIKAALILRLRPE